MSHENNSNNATPPATPFRIRTNVRAGLRPLRYYAGVAWAAIGGGGAADYGPTAVSGVRG